MINIEKVQVLGWSPAIRGMRNPLNSWDKGDTVYGTVWGEIDGHLCVDDGFTIGKNDLDLMKRLANGDSDDRKYLRMIVVYMDITAPLYWWKEFDTYKVGTVANSCSTMHKIHSRDLTVDDFSAEHLFNDGLNGQCLYALEVTISELNKARNKFLETKDKKYWHEMIQLLPSSYNQKRTVMLNYEVLKNMYHARKNHKLDEWRTFCEQVKTLPYSKELIIGE